MRLSCQLLEDRTTPRAGDLDLSFGTNGHAAIPFLDSVLNSEVAPDGKIYVVGTISPMFDVGIVRLLPDGQPDPTFGDDGLATITFPQEGLTIALRSDGGVVLGAYRNLAVFKSIVQRNPEVAVFTPNGQLDPTFDADGRREFLWGNQPGSLTDISVRPDGSIVAAGLAGC